ncbi:VanZ family protein [Paenibacillus tengchongensis]|uniref:VanZ family protein n=1 Tax=Paenibacillus tengchongensis TaxID=2608684 RepID=UPI001651B984|nr:VanZ family protein [Paenibacillus tengchongensis]
MKQPRRIWARLLLFFYAGTVIYWMFIGFGRTPDPEGPLQYNLEPLRTIKLYFNLDNGVSYGYRLVNLLGNVAVFVPFGFLLPLVRGRLRSIVRLTLYSVLWILLLECLQMLLHVGSFDIDDLLLNLLGVWIGYALLGFAKRK